MEGTTINLGLHGKQSLRKLGIAKLHRPGKSYMFTLPKWWVEINCEENEKGEVWIEFIEENGKFIIQPLQPKVYGKEG